MGCDLDRARLELVGETPSRHSPHSSVVKVGCAAKPFYDQVDDPGDDRRQDDVVEVAELVSPLFPVVADALPDQRQHQYPGDAAGEGVGREAPERHPRDPGGK